MNAWVSILLPLVSTLINAMTPTLRNLLQEFLLDLYKRARETENPFDDMVTAALLALLGIPSPRS